ncbi:probable sucrose-phosphate synthase 4 isoform X2 [Amborella trichopoda]|nr:probable sucrose-phosphate synthase 4 isoform X2 [Amborella trichopoda]|eukprot:XP_020519016.1 probable sucrose-phosphate synthase 4 isoform X2 [Amborella trichopoda]
MCWRIWHLARKKKKIEWDDARRLAKRYLKREQGRKDAAADMSEDLSEGEKEKGESSLSDASKENIARINSDLQMWSEENKDKRLYIVLISLHGLVRGENMELGRDSDTGGQVKYVVELARALAATRGVYRVDLLTRQISSPDLDWSYSEPTEMLTCPPSDDNGDGESGGAYIVRIPSGPRDKYIHKESLWPHIPEFVDGALVHITNMAKALGGSTGDPMWPYVIHGHYADACECAAMLAGALGVPMVMTGHSLGRNKLEQLLKQGRLSKEDINRSYHIMRRVEGEELGLDAAEMVVTSTRQEVEEQWGLYDGFDVKLERKLRARSRRGVSCLGRYMPRMAVIPPGMDFSHVTSQDMDTDTDIASLISFDRNQAKRDIPPIWAEVMRFFTNPHKPMILALSRPDPKKNVTTLLKAFGECRPLRELANLTLILGNRDDIETMPISTASLLTTVLKLIDKYDLYGQVAYPKHHRQADVPEIYRLAAKTKGVFINPALVEPFGLTVIEASAYGLPVVATKNGGPVDILKALNNGLLVDPHDDMAIADALLKLVADKALWTECRKNGRKNIHRFSWPEHCKNYLSHAAHCCNRRPSWRPAPHATGRPALPENEPLTDSLRDILDLSIRFSVDVKLNCGTDSVRLSGDPTAANPQQLLDAMYKAAGTTESLLYNGGNAFQRGSVPRSLTIVNSRWNLNDRKRHFVIAVDCFDEFGKFTKNLSDIIQNVMAAAGSDDRGRTGFLFSTGCSLGEVIEALRSCHVEPGEFDGLICGSGSVVCYPWKGIGDDMEYGAHVGYRWPGENARTAVERLAAVEGDDVADDVEACGSHCYAYAVKDGGKVPRVDDLRQRLRMRALRCNLVYTRAGTRLNVVPLFASRDMALRYLSIRWGMDLSKTVVFVGEKGDTDYESLLPGLHKTIILKDAVEHGSEKLVRGSGSYQREDVVPCESPNIVSTELGYATHDISIALDKVGHM